jgi:rubrerythrin
MSSLAEAKATLTALRTVQKQLHQIKRNVDLDMKTIRAQYRQKSTTSGTMPAAFLRGFGKRKLAGQLRADVKRALVAECYQVLAPYDALKLQIDELLVKTDGAKALLDNFIEMARVELQTQERTAIAWSDSPRVAASAKFCTQCGQPVSGTKRFCSSCGHALE